MERKAAILAPIGISTRVVDTCSNVSKCKVTYRDAKTSRGGVINSKKLERDGSAGGGGLIQGKKAPSRTTQFMNGPL